MCVQSYYHVTKDPFFHQACYAALTATVISDLVNLTLERARNTDRSVNTCTGCIPKPLRDGDATATGSHQEERPEGPRNAQDHVDHGRHRSDKVC